MKTKGDRLDIKNKFRLRRRFHWGQDLFNDQNDKSYLVADTPKPCSCFLCGNPRKYNNKRTIKEISFDEISKFDI